MSVTVAPTMPVAVAKIAQVASVASASDAGTGPAASCKRAEQTIENIGALDDVAHEDEQRDRDQHVVRHHRIGALDEQLEDQIAHREVAEEHAERHQREGDGKAEHDEDDEQAEHDHAQLGIADAEHQIDPLRWPISSSLVTCSNLRSPSGRGRASSRPCRRCPTARRRRRAAGPRPPPWSPLT